MRSRLWAVLLLSSLAVGAVAFAQDPPAGPEGPAAEEEEEPRRMMSIGRIGERRITVGEVEDAINGQAGFLRLRYRDPRQVRAFFNQMMRVELLARAAEQAGYGDDPATLRDARETAVQQMIREDIDDAITVESVPEEDVRAEYEASRDQFEARELRRAQHILVATEEEATALLAELRESDSRTFRQRARDRSLDTETNLRGGDLRFFDDQGRLRNESAQSIHPALVEATFAIEETGFADAPIQVDDHWSVLKLVSIRATPARSEEVALRILRQRLWRERRREAYRALVRELRESTEVALHPERMAGVELDVEEPEEPDAPNRAKVPPGREPAPESEGAEAPAEAAE